MTNIENICEIINSRKIYKNITFTPENTRLVVKYLSNCSTVEDPVIFKNQVSFTDFRKIKKQVYEQLFLSAVEQENLEILKDELFEKEMNYCCNSSREGGGGGYIKKLIDDHVDPCIVGYNDWWFKEVSCEYSFSVEFVDGVIFIPLYSSCILDDTLEVWIEVCIV